MSPIAKRELERVIQPTWTDAAVAILVFAAGAFTSGYELAKWRAAQEPKPAPVIVERVPLMQFKCTSGERREYLEACKQRLQSAMTRKP